MSHESRAGLSKWDLLALIAIIGLLVALLLPAVNGPGRGESRRSVCMNNLQQLGIAMNGFEVTEGRYPGWHDDSIGNKDCSWAVSLLPRLDSQALYDLWANDEVSPTDPRLAPFLPVLICPSDVNKMGNRKQPGNSYIANGGFLPRPGVDPKFPRGAYDPPPAAEGTADGLFVNAVPIYDEQDNLLLAASRVTSADVKDGISNTIAFSEHLLAGRWTKSDLNSKYPNGAAPYYPEGVTVMGWLYASDDLPGFAKHSVDSASPDPLPEPTRTTNDMHINCNKRTILEFRDMTAEHVRPSSNHPGVVLVQFADNHGIILREGIEYRVYQQLLTINDAQSRAPHRQKPLVLSDYEY